MGVFQRAAELVARKARIKAKAAMAAAAPAMAAAAAPAGDVVQVQAQGGSLLARLAGLEGAEKTAFFREHKEKLRAEAIEPSGGPAAPALVLAVPAGKNSARQSQGSGGNLLSQLGKLKGIDHLLFFRANKAALLAEDREMNRQASAATEAKESERDRTLLANPLLQEFAKLQGVERTIFFRAHQKDLVNLRRS